MFEVVQVQAGTVSHLCYTCGALILFDFSITLLFLWCCYLLWPSQPDHCHRFISGVMWVTNWSGLESVCIKRSKFILSSIGKRRKKIWEAGICWDVKTEISLKKVLWLIKLLRKQVEKNETAAQCNKIAVSLKWLQWWCCAASFQTILWVALCSEVIWLHSLLLNKCEPCTKWVIT